jgi:hypothetical protein
MVLVFAASRINVDALIEIVLIKRQGFGSAFFFDIPYIVWWKSCQIV